MTTTAKLTALIALLALGTGPAAAQASDAQREAAAENFMQADVDANGKLTKSEFKTLIDLNAADGIGRAAMIKRFGRYDMAFARADANANGIVTPEEMQALAAKAGG